MEKNFCKVRSIGDIIASLLLILFGFGFIILPGAAAINVTGTFVLIAGIILALAMKSAYKDSSTGELYSKKERYFSHAKQEELKHSLTSPNHFCTKGENEGNSLRLDIYYNHNKMYIQLLEYVPYSYEPCSQFYEHDLDKGLNFLQKK